MRIAAALLFLFTGLNAQANVSWHTITPEIQFLKQQSKLRFYDSNQVLIEGKKCALMVDASGNFAEVESLAKQLKQRLKTPLCYLVASHFHDDHLLGLAVLQAEFPDAKLIVHQQVASEFAAMQQALKDKLDGYEKSIELSYQRLANQPEDQQTIWRDKLTLAKQRLFRWRKLSLNPPAISVSKQTSLELGHYPITLTPYRAHTQGDLTITADHGRVLVGADIVDSLPYPGHGELENWLATLKKIHNNTELVTILPGHGEQLNTAELAKPIAFLNAIITLTKAQPDKSVEELIELFPEQIKQQYQLDEIGNQAFTMFLEAGLKKAKLSK
ncbi:MBL fold metallo-hydrolase [Pseudoalteromonas sp. Ps84H-4]|jgi:hydroxyacylglutathione hydrolase|uniref:MBL fold metallo-hydrolase n=1 Tax=Pseudoalteromonas sp. Ps84H-4 TaxID=2954502 RepID=UPI002097F5F5|nr:MBL fold metallo-hydrolase [Pseudoalteromonas sp. Ps84H-4]MCO7249382.1 MBL fold metallo-hydrolase [Pseudoalteromonas sp. Ps84H-4]